MLAVDIVHYFVRVNILRCVFVPDEISVQTLA